MDTQTVPRPFDATPRFPHWPETELSLLVAKTYNLPDDDQFHLNDYRRRQTENAILTRACARHWLGYVAWYNKEYERQAANLR